MDIHAFIVHGPAGQLSGKRTKDYTKILYTRNRTRKLEEDVYRRRKSNEMVLRSQLLPHKPDDLSLIPTTKNLKAIPADPYGKMMGGQRLTQKLMGQPAWPVSTRWRMKTKIPKIVLWSSYTIHRHGEINK